MKFWIDVETSAGAKVGLGPITSASNFRFTSRIDRSGDFSFELAASDPKASAIQRKRVIRAYAILNGQRVNVGSGVIDLVERDVQPDGTVILRVSGNDLLRELTYRSVLNLKLYDNNEPVSQAVALSAVEGYAPAGWTFVPDGSPPNNSVYAYFGGESVLSAILKIADKTYSHFVGGLDRTVTFLSDFTPSGVRAIQAKGNLVANTCAITSLVQKTDVADFVSRVYARGSGNSEVQLTLRATSRTAPAGYTLNAAQNYIEHDASVATYGVIERQVDFRDIGPIENTATDIQSAANALFDAALETLQRRSTELEQETYSLQVEGCSQLLRPMQTIRVAYRDLSAGLNINDDLNILEATWQVDNKGVQTTNLVVSNVDRWPRSDVGVIVDGIEQGHVYQALQQLNANSYTIAHLKHIDDTETATIDLDLGNEVTQVQQILMRFRLKAFESTVRSVGGASSGSGDIPTSGPSTDSTSTGGNNETGTGGATSTGSTTPTIGSTTPDIGSSTPTIGSGGANDTGTGGGAATSFSVINETASGGGGDVGGSGSLFTSPVTPTIGTTTPSIGATTPTIGTTTPSIGTTTPTIGTTTPSIGATGLTTNTPTGGDVVGSGRHEHIVPVYDITPGSGAAIVWCSPPSGPGSNWEFFAATGNNREVLTTPRGNHTHSVSGHTHTIDPHTHSMSGHNHTMSGHTHTQTGHSHSMSGHTHSLPGHSHSMSSHTHSIASHTHTTYVHTHSTLSHTHSTSSHTHTIASHTHTMTSHTHTIAAHTHTMTSHTHSMAQHTHSLNNHTHDLSESIAAVYGIFREESGNTYGIGDLQYQVNSGGWVDLDTATDLGGGRYELDITSLIVNATTLRQNQELNTIDFRRDPVAAADKTVMLDVQVKVRTIIQAIALT